MKNSWYLTLHLFFLIKKTSWSWDLVHFEALFMQISRSIHIPPPPPTVMTRLPIEAKLAKHPKKCQNPPSSHFLNEGERYCWQTG